MDGAEPGTTLVSGTTRELASGAGIEFVDRGTRSFKGITEQRTVNEARLPAADPGAAPTAQNG